jgi:hypothetical protein
VEVFIVILLLQLNSSGTYLVWALKVCGCKAGSSIVRIVIWGPEVVGLLAPDVG